MESNRGWQAAIASMSNESQISRVLRLKRSTIEPDTKPASAAHSIHIPPKPATDNAVPVMDKPV